MKALCLYGRLTQKRAIKWINKEIGFVSYSSNDLLRKTNIDPLWTRSYEHEHLLPFFFPILTSPQCQKRTDHRYETESMVILNSLFHRYSWNHSVILISLENISIL